MTNNESHTGVARRDSRPSVAPMPESKIKLDYEARFTPTEYDKLRRGLVPRNMDQRWFIFMEDDWLFIHRDSSGFCIYQVRVDRMKDEYAVTEAYANRDPRQYKQVNDEYDKQMLGWIIEDLLLGHKRSPPPRPSS